MCRMLAVGLAFLGVLLGTSVAGARAAEESGKALVQRVYLDKFAPQDPGMIVVLLRNTTDKPVGVEELRLNGASLTDWPGRTDPFAWHRVCPAQIPPGGAGIAQIKLAQPLAGLARVDTVVNSQTVTTLLNMADCEPVRLAAVRYDPEGGRVNLFVTNSGPGTQRIHAIELNGKTVWESAEGRPLAREQTEAFRIKTADAIRAGDELVWTVRLADRSIGVRSRAIPGFRVSVESGDKMIAERIKADPLVLDSFQFRQESTASSPSKAAESLEQRQGTRWTLVSGTHTGTFRTQQSDLVCVFACPTHATDCYQTSAYLAMMAQKQVQREACWQSFIHCCRSQPLPGLAVFGPLADCVRFNCQLETPLKTEAANREDLTWTTYNFVRYGVAAASPSAAVPMVPLEKDKSFFDHRAPLAAEVRSMAYASLAAGAGGLAYRMMERDWGKESRDPMIEEVRSINDEIRQVRDLLAFGFPRPLTYVEDPHLQVVCIDAMPKGMLVLVINHDLQRSPPEMIPSVTAQPREDVTLMVEIPDDMQISRVSEISGDHCAELEDYEQEAQQLRITLPEVGGAMMLLLEPEQVEHDE